MYHVRACAVEPKNPMPGDVNSESSASFKPVYQSVPLQPTQFPQALPLVLLSVRQKDSQDVNDYASKQRTALRSPSRLDSLGAESSGFQHDGDEEQGYAA